MFRLTQLTHSVLGGARKARTLLFVLCVAVALAALPGVALATESPTEEKIKTVTTQVSSEGVAIVIAVLAGLAALIAAIIIIPKAIGMIKRFI